MPSKKISSGGSRRGAAAAVRPRLLPVVSSQVQPALDKRLRIGGILRGTAHSKLASYAIEIGFPTFEERNPIMSEEISASVLQKLNDAGFTYEDAIDYIRTQPGLGKRKGK